MQTISISDLAPVPGLAARPDVLWFAIAAVVEGQGPTRSIPRLRDAAGVLLRHLAAVHPMATLTPRRLALGGGSADKASKQDRSDVHLEGVLHVPLEGALDFWARAELAARAIDALVAASSDLARQKPAVTLGWREPVARIADAEAHRPKLVEHQRAHLRGLLEGAPGVTLGDLPTEIVQLPVSFDEVRLTLGALDGGRRRDGRGF